MAIPTSSIPRISENTVRFTLKLDGMLMDEARKLKIDVHELFRMSLRIAVDELKKEKLEGMKGI